MNNDIEKYCKSIQKRTEKVLYKLFGKKDTIKNYLQLKKQLKDEIESEINKPVEEIKRTDLFKVGYTYSKYKTLEKVLNVYTTVIELNLINKVED